VTRDDGRIRQPEGQAAEAGDRPHLAVILTDRQRGVVLGLPEVEADGTDHCAHFGKDRPKPFMALDRRGSTIYCSSFSKTVAPGYRIGWIATERHMQRVLASKLAFTLCGPALPQVALADFLSSGGYDIHLRRIRRVFEDNIEQMIRTIEKAFPRGTRVTRLAGGFVLWLELPKPLNSRESLR
jgi:DNA-binding transcriptional MocR family regulator